MTTSASGVDSTAQGGAQINFVTRSGTNALARRRLLAGPQHRSSTPITSSTIRIIRQHPNGLPRDIVKLNQEGGHIGGPIMKNKLFFFGNVEIYRFPGTNLYTRTYLTPSASSGIYTYADSSGALHNVNLLALAAAANPSLPAGTRPYPTTADPTSGQDLRADAVSSAPSGIVKNNQSTSDYNTLTTSYQPNGTDARDFFTTRIDYNVTQKHVLSFIYNYDWYAAVPDFLNGIVPDFPGSGTVLFSQRQHRPAQQPVRWNHLPPLHLQARL